MEEDIFLCLIDDYSRKDWIGVFCLQKSQKFLDVLKDSGCLLAAIEKESGLQLKCLGTNRG